jgi:hypothetical protein
VKRQSGRADDDPEFRLKALQAQRLRLHRLDPSRPIRGVRAAAQFVHERRLVLTTGRSSLPMLAEAVVGRAISGSWMADPEVHRVYDIVRRVRKYDLFAVPLVQGKETLIDPALGPAVERIASDPNRQALATRALPPLARRLLEDVERAGAVRMDRWDVPTARARRARLLLERELLVGGVELHTERGYHTSVVTQWHRGTFSQRFAHASARLALAAATDQVLAAAVRSAVVAPEREVRRWFPFGGDRIDALIARGALERLVVGRRAWLTTAGVP